MAGTVTVASKLPHKLILQLQEEFTVSEPVMGGGLREVPRWRKCGKTIEINGFAKHVDRPSDITLVEGFALTPGVDADFFNQWLEQNKDFPPVARGFIFAHGAQKDVNAQIREMRGEKSGFEPTDPNNLPDEFRGDRGEDMVTKAVA